MAAQQVARLTAAAAAGVAAQVTLPLGLPAVSAANIASPCRMAVQNAAYLLAQTPGTQSHHGADVGSCAEVLPIAKQHQLLQQQPALQAWALRTSTAANLVWSKRTWAA